MPTVRMILSRFWQEEHGATMVEYGFMASLIAVAAFAGVSAFGTSLHALYVNIQDQIAAATQ